MQGWTLLAAWGLVNVLASAVVARDKAAAKAGRRRVPESTFHALALVGGWPGGRLAMAVWRHKTRKVVFRLRFAGAGLVGNLLVALLGAWALGYL